MYYHEKVKALVITGSSGLYESAMGGGYTKRSDYEVIKNTVDSKTFSALMDKIRKGEEAEKKAQEEENGKEE